MNPLLRKTAHILFWLLWPLAPSSCSLNRPHDETESRNLDVNVFELKDVPLENIRDGLIRAEYERRFWGAVAPSERQDRLGQYLTVRWKPQGAIIGNTPVTVRLRYRRGATGSRIHELLRPYPSQQARQGLVAEFHFIGPEFRQMGRVTSWMVTVEQRGQVLAREESYLWQ